MTKNEKFENGLFIFRRDLRIVDNNGLNLLNEHCKNIFAIFIFTPEQVGNGNKYKSDNSVQFMIESLDELSSQISKSGGHLYTFFGHNDKIIADCIKAWNINVVCFNLDITPYAKERDTKIIKLCEHLKTYVMYTYDYYLHQPGTIVNGSGEPYQKFTPYYETAMKKHIDPPSKMRKIHLTSSSAHITNKITLDQALKKFTKVNPDILVHGGRVEAIKVLKTALRTQQHYSKTHNELEKSTTQLSAYIKFGCVSIREVYKALRSKTALIRQLYWRDFYANILYSFPHVLGHSLKPKYDKIHWHHNQRWLKAWTNGETGFPIVDAGMRQLNQTGYMANRARLIVASFLIKTLLIDWREGEEYFATKLTDYDPASNNGNWEWCAGSGADSQPWFRIFNPWRQTEEYDPNCKYIKEWIPELKDVPVKDIFRWDTEYNNYKDTKYPKPICNYEQQREKVIKMYKSYLY
jgi:deoxyribodipyrimidine photo-lyase